MARTSILILFSILFLQSCTPDFEEINHIVVSVHNGNILELNNGVMVNLAGIEGNQQSQQYLEQTVLNHKVQITFDSRNYPSDLSPGQTIFGYAKTQEGLALNGTLIKEKFADPDFSNTAYDSIDAFNSYTQGRKVSSPSTRGEGNNRDYGGVLVTSNGRTVVEMVKSGGVYEIPVFINDVPMHFIFDTGASSISISGAEALFLLKQGKLREEDIIGKQKFIDATGNISEGTTIILSSVKLGNKTLHNVEASVVHNLDAPLLFGQTALERFGKISLDYNKGTITFE